MLCPQGGELALELGSPISRSRLVCWWGAGVASSVHWSPLRRTLARGLPIGIKDTLGGRVEISLTVAVTAHGEVTAHG